MATLAENIDRGNAAMAAAELDPTDAGTRAADAITHILHAGYANAQSEARFGIAAPNLDEGGAKFVPGETDAASWLDDVLNTVRDDFLAEQGGEES